MLLRLCCHFHVGHDYKFYSQYLISAGMRKVVIFRCEICGKEKAYII